MGDYSFSDQNKARFYFLRLDCLDLVQGYLGNKQHECLRKCELHFNCGHES
jgi:hypothetical protein